MNLNTFNNQNIKQNQSLTTNQLQSLNILSFSMDELGDFIESEHMENPMLLITNYTSSHENFESAYYNVAAPTKDSIKDHLHHQINKKEYTDVEFLIINYLIESIDENTGFLTVNSKDIYRKYPEHKETIEKCLTLIHSLEPIGIGCENLQESLIIQAKHYNIYDENLYLIIKNHLQDIADGKISSISRSLHLSTDQVRGYIKKIKTLNPRPSQGFGNTTIEYIVPDVIISFDGEKWNISLNDNWSGNITINQTYKKMAEQTNDEVLIQYFKEKLERARFIVNSIEQRRNTLLKVSESILNNQIDYINSKGVLRPLILEDIALELGIHLSTVSRTIKNKYIQTPRGTFPMKNFFTSSVVNSTVGATVSSEYVKEKIKQIINEENKNKPLSDNKISALLKNFDIDISRRTITKYREEMGIPSTIVRKTE